MPLQTTVLLIKSLDKPSAALPPLRISVQKLNRMDSTLQMICRIALGTER